MLPEKEEVQKKLFRDIYLLFRDNIISLQNDYNYLLLLTLSREYQIIENYISPIFHPLFKHTQKYFNGYIKDIINNKILLGDKYKKIILDWWVKFQKYDGLSFMEIVLTVYLLLQLKYRDLPVLHLYFEHLIDDTKIDSESFMENVFRVFFNNLKSQLFTVNITQFKSNESLYCKLVYKDNADIPIFTIDPNKYGKIIFSLFVALALKTNDDFTVFEDFTEQLNKDTKIMELVKNIKAQVQFPFDT